MEKFYKIKVLLPLIFGVFAVLTIELGMMGIIPVVAERFGVSASVAAWSVSIFALAITIFAPLVPLLCARFSHKFLLVLAMSMFLLTTALSIFAPNFWVLLFLRGFGAVFHPIFCGLAFSVAASLADSPKNAPKMVGLIFGAVSAGMVLGAPLISYFGGNFGYEMAMGIFALLALFGLIFVAFLPPLPLPPKFSLKAQFGILKSPILWLSTLCVIVLNSGLFGFYTYYAQYFLGLGLDYNAISLALLIYGGFNIVGNLISGFLLVQKPVLSLFGASVFIALFYALLSIFAPNLLLIYGILGILGVLAGVLNSGFGYLIASPFPQQKELANGIFLSAANVGFFAGISILGVVLARFGAQLLPFFAGALLILGGFLVIFRARFLGVK